MSDKRRVGEMKCQGNGVGQFKCQANISDPKITCILHSKTNNIFFVSMDSCQSLHMLIIYYTNFK